MSALETIRLKLASNEYTFSDHSLSLIFDPRHNQTMPWSNQARKFLEDIRREDRVKPLPRSHYEARSRAKFSLLSMFAWNCPAHGEAPHHTHSGKCAVCYKESKRPVVRARVEATGPTYMHSCQIHGMVEHSTARGLCLRCYNTLGQPRPVSTNPHGYFVNRDGAIRPAPE